MIYFIYGYRLKKIPSPKWRKSIKKVWEVAPPECSKYGSKMKIISFTNDAGVICKTLGILGCGKTRFLYKVPPDLIRNKNYNLYDDGLPKYKEPSANIH